MKKLLVLMIFVGSLLTLNCSNKPVRIEGRITRMESTQPIADAWVYDPSIKVAKAIPEDTVEKPLTQLEDNLKIARSDSMGYYVLEGVPLRRHAIYFAAKDHEPLKVDFKPRSRKGTYVINVQLEPSPIEVKF